MVLNLQHEFTYVERPLLPIRLRVVNGLRSVNTEALLDTGAAISLLDAELAAPLGALGGGNNPLDWLNVVGIGGRLQRVPIQVVLVSALGVPDRANLGAAIVFGFVPGLAKGVGNLLGRNFFDWFDFAIHHAAPSSFYLGRTLA